MHKKDNVMVLMKIWSFGLPWQDAQVWNNGRRKCKEQLANLHLPGRWPLNRGAYALNTSKYFTLLVLFIRVRLLQTLTVSQKYNRNITSYHLCKFSDPNCIHRTSGNQWSSWQTSRHQAVGNTNCLDNRHMSLCQCLHRCPTSDPFHESVTIRTNELIDWIKVLPNIRHKIGHFGNTLSSQSLLATTLHYIHLTAFFPGQPG